MENSITYFAKTNFRNRETPFGIKRNDRPKHAYVIGKTGTGKTTLLENMALQDIKNGEGLAIVDPHGTFVEKMLDFIPKERVQDVIYFNPSDTEFSIAFNIMEDVGADQRHLVAAGLMGVFKKMWPDVWSARMEYILNNAVLALLEYPDSTLLGVNRVLADKKYRKEVVQNTTDPVVKAFWEQEFAGYTERFAAEATPAIQNKVGQLTSNAMIRNIIGQPKSSFDFRKAMDEKKIVLVNLSKGRIGEQNSNLIGAMIITKIYLAAMSRAANPEQQWPPFYLYVDEFQNFATESFKDILSEARKYNLALILAHQYIAQLPEGVSDAIFGNVGTHIVFRVGPSDAEVLEKEFSPEFTLDDIVNLGVGNVYLKLSIDGVPSRPFSAQSFPPIEKPAESSRGAIVEFSRKSYCKSKEIVEKEINAWHEPLEKPAEERENFGQEEGRVVQTRNEPENSPRLFEAVCSVCGKKTIVPFEPDGKRPIYCQKHRNYLSESKKESVPNVIEQSDKAAIPFVEEKIKKEEAVSLNDLQNKTQDFRGGRSRRDRSTPDLRGLREVLSETVKDMEMPIAPAIKEKEQNDKKILRPGDKISFN